MKRWRFALSKRWVGYLAVAVVFAVVCVVLANWQLSRREEKEEQIALVERNYDSEPVPVAELLPDSDSWDPRNEWKPVLIEGEYLGDEQLLVRNRPRSGQPGFQVLVPLLTDDGRVFVVDRGWLPTGNEQDLPDVIPAPPEGQVSVVAHLKPGEPVLAGRSAPEGQIASIQLDEISSELDRETYTGAYGLLVSESPPAQSRPLATMKPQPDEGPHLSYAFQWFIFALMGFAFLAYAVRQEYRLLHADEPDQVRREAERTQKRESRRSDADIEDELIDGYTKR